MGVRSIGLSLALALVSTGAMAQAYGQQTGTGQGGTTPPPVLYAPQYPLPTPAPNPNGPYAGTGAYGAPNGVASAYGTTAPNYGAQNGVASAYGTQAPGVAPQGAYTARPPVMPYQPPMTPLPDNPAMANNKVNPLMGIPVDPPGFGWCRYTDETDKKTFYSSPFPGSPKHDMTPRDVAFADYIHRAYPGFQGNVDCYWQPFDNAYDSKTIEDQNESSDQLRNYTMTNTQWKPPAI